MDICSNIRCNKVINMDKKGIKVKYLCPECEERSRNESFTSVYCEYCGRIYVVRPRLLGEKVSEISICPKCKVELEKRKKEEY